MTYNFKYIFSKGGIHLIFWMLSYWILLRYFAYTDEIHLVDHIYTGLFHLSLLIVFYGNVGLLIPALLLPHRYLSYIVSAGLLILAGAGINEVTFNYLSDWLFSDFYFISYYSYLELFQFMGIYWAASTLLILSQSWFKLRRTEQHLEQVEKARIQSELAMLKAQVNPHFLFNSLHNIYALTLEADKRSSTMILRLSNILRYTLYEAKSATVPLGKELTCVEQYIDIQKIRMPEVAINYTKKNTENNFVIAPLLLLPLIENAFKHGNVSQGNFYVNITILVNNKTLTMNVKNSMAPVKITQEAVVGGIGLENLQRRLTLLYPKTHVLETNTDHSSYFQTTLNLEISHDDH